MAITEAAQAEYNAEVLKSAKDNHMWLNAFSCIHPTDEMRLAIGDWVLKQLNDPEATILSSLCREGALLAGLDQRELVVSFNKS